MIHVPHVQFKLLFPREAVAAIDLSPPGDAGLDLVATALELGIPGQVFGQQWAGTDEAHITLEDVPELRQLVETTGAQETAERRETPLVGKKHTARVTGGGHRPEFEKRKGSLAKADAMLSKQHRAAHPKANQAPNS